MMSSKTGDLLLELEAENGTVRDRWVSAVDRHEAKIKSLCIFPGA